MPATSNDPLTKTLALLLRETISSVLATGGIDAAVCVDTNDVAKNVAPNEGGKALPAVTAGIRVKDGAALENRVKQTFGGQNGGKPLLPPGVKIAFDSGKVGTTNLHTITVDVSGTDAAERLGETVDITLAVTPEYAFLMAGGDPQQRLAAVLGPAGKANSEAKPIVGVDVSVSRLMAPILAEFGVLPTDSSAAGDDTGNDRQGGDVTLLIRPIDRGVATRLSADATASGVGGRSRGNRTNRRGKPQRVSTRISTPNPRTVIHCRPRAAIVLRPVSSSLSLKHSAVITNSPTAASLHASETAAGTSAAAGIRTQIAGVSVADLAHDHGTPLYAYDAEMIRHRCRDLAAWDTVRFAQKACSNLAVLDLIRREGVMVDAVSTGEIHRALQAGYSAHADRGTAADGLPPCIRSSTPPTSSTAAASTRSRSWASMSTVARPT